MLTNQPRLIACGPAQPPNQRLQNTPNSPRNHALMAATPVINLRKGHAVRHNNDVCVVTETGDSFSVTVALRAG